jgi:hypothetical protein
MSLRLHPYALLDSEPGPTTPGFELTSETDIAIPRREFVAGPVAVQLRGPPRSQNRNPL